MSSRPVLWLSHGFFRAPSESSLSVRYALKHCRDASMNGPLVSLSPGSPFWGCFLFFSPSFFTPHLSSGPKQFSRYCSLHELWKCGNVHMAQLPCTAALSGFIFTAKFILGGKVEGRKTENVCSAICLTQGTAYASTGIIIGQN